MLQDGSAEASSTEARPPRSAAWSLVQGLATLHLTGNLAPSTDVDALEMLTRDAAAHLFRET